MYSHGGTANRQINRPNKVTRQSFLLVIFTPIYIRSTSNARAIEDMRWLDTLQFPLHSIPVFHTHSRHVYIASLSAKQGLKMAGHPAAASPYQEDIVFGGVHARHLCSWVAEFQGSCPGTWCWMGCHENYFPQGAQGVCGKGCLIPSIFSSLRARMKTFLAGIRKRERA